MGLETQTYLNHQAPSSFPAPQPTFQRDRNGSCLPPQIHNWTSTSATSISCMWGPSKLIKNKFHVLSSFISKFILGNSFCQLRGLALPSVEMGRKLISGRANKFYGAPIAFGGRFSSTLALKSSNIIKHNIPSSCLMVVSWVCF